jgi:PKD repeat protein
VTTGDASYSGVWGEPIAVSGTAVDPSATDSAAGLAPSWAWGDGTASTKGLDATHVYAKPGTYTATFSAVDKDGGLGETTVTITVGKRTASLGYTADATQTAGAISLTAQLSDDADPATAQLGNEPVLFVVGTIPVVAHTGADGAVTATPALPLLPGTYSVTVTFPGDERYASATVQGTLTIEAAGG